MILKKVSYRNISSIKQIIIVLGLGVMFFTNDLLAQQDAQYTQYMYNTVSVNPAYTGSRGHLSVAALHRSQWVGLDGAPVTQTINLHSPVGYSGVGLGTSIVNDKIGPTSETYFDIDFSYTVQTSDVGRLSFGLKGSAHLVKPINPCIAIISKHFWICLKVYWLKGHSHSLFV